MLSKSTIVYSTTILSKKFTLLLLFYWVIFEGVHLSPSPLSRYHLSASDIIINCRRQLCNTIIARMDEQQFNIYLLCRYLRDKLKTTGPICITDIFLNVACKPCAISLSHQKTKQRAEILGETLELRVRITRNWIRWLIWYIKII